MLTEFKLPELGENIKSGTAVKITVKAGDSVKKDQTVLELETEKASIELPSPVNGIIKEILIKEGQEINVGQVIMKIETEAKAGAAAKAQTPQPKQSAQTASSNRTSSEQATAVVTAPVKPSPTAATRSLPPTFVAPGAGKDVAAAPSVRRFAREIGVDITQIPGSGPGGRISTDDVKAFAKRILTGGMLPAGGISQPPLPDFSKWGSIERKPMNNIRRKTAEHLTSAWATIPHVTQFDKADITELEKLRKRLSAPERKLTITPFILKVIASALKTFPQFNASVDMNTSEIIYKKYFHIGVAVDTDRGLLVPVIRDVDKKSIAQLASELSEIAERARNKKTTIEEMHGGCFTITNLGSIGGTYFTPIINSPEVAILGVSRGQWEQVFVDNQFVPRLMLPLSLSYDHRVIDGADGARFIRWVVEAIQQPLMMEMEK